MSVSADFAFPGTSRFQLVSELGAGGMGVVYEALDVDQGTHVALKTLPSLTPERLMRFKNEFHALQDIHHPNLVSLGELVLEGAQCFFTMELVDGVDFLTYVRPTGGAFDEHRLRAALAQLAEGLQALHTSHRIHRDIKPSNVLVTAQLRVVLLDFGLALDIREDSGAVARDGVVSGSPRYMSPEQVDGRPLGPQTDWFSVGVVLYEALTGRVPLEGSTMKILTEKRNYVPPRPSEIASGIPKDLDDLTMELLRLGAEGRPSGPEVIARLSGPNIEKRRPSPPVRAKRFVGRENELSRLEAAFDDVKRTRRPIFVSVEGESGIGKTALLRHLCERLRLRDPQCVILRGRCYERESVPYKALDGIVDQLTRHLRSIGREQAALLMPRWASLVPRVFPVLGRVEVLASSVRPQPDMLDPQELRARVFTALKELLAAVAESRTLVCVVDDLQWADEDSFHALAELFRAPDAPAVLFLATMRERMPEVTDRIAIEHRTLGLGPLEDEDAAVLASRLLDRVGDGPSTPALAATIAREAAGHPLFIDELVRHARSSEEVIALDLDSAVDARVTALIPLARHVLTLLVVSSAPLDEGTLAEASEIPRGELTKLIRVLKAMNLVRAAGPRADLYEPYHDRVRAALVSGLDAALTTKLHRRLALGLTTAGHADPEAIAVHWAGAGEPARAADNAVRAAERASSALAFDRAVRLYQWAHEIGDPVVDLPVRLAHALANAGRGSEASQRYLEAADSAKSAEERIDLERRAAEQLLRSGHVDEGLEIVERILDKVGMRLAPTPNRALLSLLYHRARLRLRGLSFSRRRESDIPSHELLRIDITWSIGTALGMIDTIRGADFGTQNLLIALAAGEPARIARALTSEASFSAANGTKAEKRTRTLVTLARSLAEEVESPEALGLAIHASALEAFFLCRFREAVKLEAMAERIYLEKCGGAPWEITNARMFALSAMAYLGELKEMSARIPAYLDDALARGDLYRATDFRAGPLNLIWLAADDPDTAQREADEGIKRWSQKGFHVQHYDHLIADSHISLYRGDGEAAWRRMETQWPDLEASLLLRVQFIKVDAYFLRARCALARATTLSGDDQMRGALANIARDAAKRIRREKIAISEAIAVQLEASAWVLDGDDARAIEAFGEAADLYDEVEMRLHRASVLFRRAAVEKRERGLAEARGWMEKQGVRAPDRMARVFAP